MTKSETKVLVIFESDDLVRLFDDYWKLEFHDTPFNFWTFFEVTENIFKILLDPYEEEIPDELSDLITKVLKEVHDHAPTRKLVDLRVMSLGTFTAEYM